MIILVLYALKDIAFQMNWNTRKRSAGHSKEGNSNLDCVPHTALVAMSVGGGRGLSSNFVYQMCHQGGLSSNSVHQMCHQGGLSSNFVHQMYHHRGDRGLSSNIFHRLPNFVKLYLCSVCHCVQIFTVCRAPLGLPVHKVIPKSDSHLSTFNLCSCHS